MTKREIALELSKLYVEDYQRTCRIDEKLSEEGIYVSDENDPVICGLEKILNSFNEFLVEYLLDFADEGFVDYWVKDEQGEEIHYVLESIEDILNDLVIE